jgi:hypothetical protein
MLHLLRRHPVAVAAYFRHALVLTYALPQEVLEPLLPVGLELDLWRGVGFLAVALVQTEGLRPSFLPAWCGCDFFLSGYRIFARLSGGNSLRGLRILRSDTDRRLMVTAGNLLTHYNYSLCKAELEERDGEIEWTVTTPQGEADLDVVANVGDEPAALPAGSPFQSMAEARRFAGPLPYTFDYENETRGIIGIRAMRPEWNPKPVAVEVKQATFFEQEPFCRCLPVLANAFHVQGVPYEWQRGRRMA